MTVELTWRGPSVDVERGSGIAPVASRHHNVAVSAGTVVTVGLAPDDPEPNPSTSVQACR